MIAPLFYKSNVLKPVKALEFWAYICYRISNYMWFEGWYC